MGFRKFITAIVIATLACAGAAHAALSSTYDLGDLTNGENGQMIVIGRKGAFVNTIKGSIPQHSRITFTYTLDSGTLSFVSSLGTYSYTKDGHSYSGNAYKDTLPIASHLDIIDGATGKPQLLFATANLGNPGSSSLLNTSDGTASFTEIISGVIDAIGNKKLTIKYIVSPVPLPAMASLFGVALAGLGLTARRKAKA